MGVVCRALLSIDPCITLIMHVHGNFTRNHRQIRADANDLLLVSIMSDETALLHVVHWREHCA